MSFSARSQALIGATAFGVMVITIAAALMLPQRVPAGPADVLPAAQTLLYARGLDAASLQRLIPLVPSVAALAKTEEVPSVAALLRTDEGGIGWIAFFPGREGREPRIIADPPALADLLQSDAPLASADVFASLHRHAAPSEPWIFLAEPEAVWSMPPPLRAPEGAAAITLTQSGTIISWKSDERLPPSSPLPLAQDGTTIFLHAGDLRRLLETMSSHMDDAALQGLAGLLKHDILEIFGPDISARYDLLPLLQGNASIAIRRAGSGAVTVLAGKMAGAERIIAKLHRAAGASVEAARLQRTFDDTFPMDSMRLEESDAPATEQIDPWTVTITPYGKGTFASAVAGDRFVVGNDASAVRDAIERTAPFPSSGVAEGRIDPADALHLLPGALPPDVSFLAGEDGILEWKLSREGDIYRLILQ